MGKSRIHLGRHGGRQKKLAFVPVYVDNLRDYGWRHGPSCHLIADSVEELIDFALAMGLRREWFQAKSTPHFDLTADGRKLAVELGAVELSNRELVGKVRELRRKRQLAETFKRDLGS